MYLTAVRDLGDTCQQLVYTLGEKVERLSLEFRVKLSPLGDVSVDRLYQRSRHASRERLRLHRSMVEALLR